MQSAGSGVVSVCVWDLLGHQELEGSSTRISIISSLHGNIHGQAGWGFKHPGLVEVVAAHGGAGLTLDDL